MKTLSVLFLLTFLLFNYGKTQIIQSSCVANDSVTYVYETDADRIVIRRIYQDSLTYMDSLEIPQQYSDTILNSLLAVYNASSLPAVDTVVNKLKIHTFPDIALKGFYISADSNLPWMIELKNNNPNTGNPIIDSIINNYGFTQFNYSVIPPWNTDIVRFHSDSSYNLFVITNQLDTMYWVDAYPNSYSGDGNNITAEINPSFVKLIYSYGFGDCPSGCIKRRFWEFKVYYDCKVEYIGSYGSQLVLTGVPSIIQKSTSVYPNPFENKLTINLQTSSSGEYWIYNIFGQIVKKGKLSNNSTNLQLDFLSTGTYILKVKIGEQYERFKLIKN